MNNSDLPDLTVGNQNSEVSISEVFPCVICGSEIDSTGGPDHTSQPFGATMFLAHGNYGSTVYDPIGTPENLQVNICDRCLTQAAAKRRVMRCVPIPVQEQVSRTFWVVSEQATEPA